MAIYDNIYGVENGSHIYLRSRSAFSQAPANFFVPHPNPFTIRFAHRRYHGLYGGIVKANRRHNENLKRVRAVRDDIWAAYEFTLVENGEEIAEQWEEDLKSIGTDTLKKVKQLKESAKRAKIQAPPSAAATWGMPKVTEKGRKEGIESAARTEGVRLRTRKKSEEEWNQGGEVFKEIRIKRREEIESNSSLSGKVDWDLITQYLDKADEREYTPARFKTTIDKHVLGIFQRGTGYEDTVETEATGGVDDKEGEKDMEIELGENVGEVFRKYHDEEISGEPKASPRTLIRNESRRASARLWKDIEEGVVIKQGGEVRRSPPPTHTHTICLLI